MGTRLAIFLFWGGSDFVKDKNGRFRNRPPINNQTSDNKLAKVAIATVAAKKKRKKSKWT